jgi:hypothetical protein
MDVQKTTKETIEKGGILALLYFDIHAKTKETVQEIGTGFVEELLKKDGVVYALGEIDEPILDKDIYSTSVEIKILVRTFSQLIALCAVNSPFAVEILKPDKISLEVGEAQEILTSVAATTADYKKYIVERLSKPEDLERYRHFMEKRREIGKKILERKEGE